MPALTGVELAPTAVIAHLATPDALPHPWTDTGGDGRTWQLPADTDTDVPGRGRTGTARPVPAAGHRRHHRHRQPVAAQLRRPHRHPDRGPHQRRRPRPVHRRRDRLQPLVRRRHGALHRPRRRRRPAQPGPDPPPPRTMHQPSPRSGGDAPADAGPRRAHGPGRHGRTSPRSTAPPTSTSTPSPHEPTRPATTPGRPGCCCSTPPTPTPQSSASCSTWSPPTRGRTGTAVVITGAHPHQALTTLRAHRHRARPGRSTPAWTWSRSASPATRPAGAPPCWPPTTDITDTAIPVDDTATTGWRVLHRPGRGATRASTPCPGDTPDPDVGQPAQSILPAPDSDYLQPGGDHQRRPGRAGPEGSPSRARRPRAGRPHPGRRRRRLVRRRLPPAPAVPARPGHRPHPRRGPDPTQAVHDRGPGLPGHPPARRHPRPARPRHAHPTRQGPRLREHRAGLAGHQPPHRHPPPAPRPPGPRRTAPPGSGSTRSSTSSSTPTCSGACAPAA